MKTLVIAEKPSVARDLATVLGKIKKKDDWYEDDTYIITSSVGHVVELFMPEDIDKKYAYWRMEILPIIPEKFSYKPIEKSKDVFNRLKKLIKRKDVGSLINACDAGREGELIFTYIYDLIKCKKKVQRLWMQSMTPTAIRKSFENLREDAEMLPLREAARCRSESDWIIGINGTRAITKRMYGSRAGNVASVGRVQTPTLALVNMREQQIINFKPQTFWRLVGSFKIDNGIYQGIYQKPNFKKLDNHEHDRIDRIWDSTTAKQLLAEVQNHSQATISEKKKRSKQIAPRLYDLTTLQREANSRYGFSAGRTLQLAQSLYEGKKMITYPRTDSRALPEDYLDICKNVLSATQQSDLRPHAEKVLEQEWVRKDKRIFNNAQISDHFAIIPTGENKKLSEGEAKIFDMIARRFISIFFPPAEYDVTTRLSSISKHIFKTEGKILAEPGWLAVYGKTTKDVAQDELPMLSPADGMPPKANIHSTELEEEQTKPPPRYTEATLLTAMETAGRLVDDEALAEAMKEKGLGTPATRAQIIENLIYQNYMERQGRELVPTPKAETLIAFLDMIKVEDLTSPSMTGEWEYKLHQIEQGKLSRDKFMEGITVMTQGMVERAKSFEEKDEDAELTDIIAPTDGKPMLKNFRSYKSQDGQYTIYQTISNRKISSEEVKTLISEGKIGPLNGFRSKKGKLFSAILRLDEENKVKFVFDEIAENEKNGNKDNPINLSEFQVIGICPKCESALYETTSVYGCEHQLNHDGKCDFRIFRTLLGKTIASDEVKKLLKDKKTSLIEGFRSKRTNRLFKAFLVLKENSGIGFEFPPPAKKKKVKS